MDGFWEGGLDEYLEGLHADFTQRITALREQLAVAVTSDEVTEIQRTIREVSEVYDKRLSEAQDLLF